MLESDFFKKNGSKMAGQPIEIQGFCGSLVYPFNLQLLRGAQILPIFMPYIFNR